MLILLHCFPTLSCSAILTPYCILMFLMLVYVLLQVLLETSQTIHTGFDRGPPSPEISRLMTILCVQNLKIMS